MLVTVEPIDNFSASYYCSSSVEWDKRIPWELVKSKLHLNCQFDIPGLSYAYMPDDNYEQGIKLRILCHVRRLYQTCQRAITHCEKNPVTSSIKMLESAPLQFGSLSGKSCPISGRLNAPKIESTILMGVSDCSKLKKKLKLASSKIHVNSHHQGRFAKWKTRKRRCILGTNTYGT